MIWEYYIIINGFKMLKTFQSVLMLKSNEPTKAFNFIQQ